MWYVMLTATLPGIRSTVFVFHNENEAYEFQSCLHSRYPDAQTELGAVGEATEVFESWSY